MERADYAQFTAEDHAKAVAFRLLGSACIEDYAEKRCKEIAETSIVRIRRGQPSASGRSLIIRYIIRKDKRAYPIHDADVLGNLDLADEALRAYTDAVKSSHGIAGKDLQQLVYPLGIRDQQIPDILVTGLSDLSKVRDPASHIYTNRAKTMVEPIAEWRRVNQLMPHIRQLDADLGVASVTYPL